MPPLLQKPEEDHEDKSMRHADKDATGKNELGVKGPSRHKDETCIDAEVLREATRRVQTTTMMMRGQLSSATMWRRGIETTLRRCLGAFVRSKVPQGGGSASGGSFCRAAEAAVALGERATSAI